MRVWFCPGRGRALSLRIAETIGRARDRVRIASPVITSGPILGTLAEEIADGRLDVAGIVDGPQVDQVFHQWEVNGNAAWKTPLLQRVMAGRFAAKASTPWRARAAIHDFMHAKITVADDTVFLGSFNLSHSGEMNAENVLEIADRRARRPARGADRRVARALRGQALTGRDGRQQVGDRSRIVVHRDQVEVFGGDHALGEHPPAHPVQEPGPVLGVRPARGRSPRPCPSA